VVLPPPRDDNAPLARPREPSEHNHRWGYFIFALIRNKNRTWSWQCTCKCHALSAWTGCKRKKVLRPDKPFEEESSNVLVSLKHWANRASLFDRQRWHIADPLCTRLSPELVEARQLRDPPPAVVKTDAELDVE